MAKKAVATFSAKSGAKTMVKCIRMDKSSKTGAYMFKEDLVEAETVKDFFAKKYCGHLSGHCGRVIKDFITLFFVRYCEFS